MTATTFPIADAGGVQRNITQNTNGRAAAADSKPVAIATEDLAALTAMAAAINGLTGSEYEWVAANATATLGGTGAIGDLLSAIIIVPLTTAPGAVTLKDSAGGAAITLFAGGSVPTTHPVPLGLGIRSSLGAWQVTTGANVGVFATGNFT